MRTSILSTRLLCSMAAAIAVAGIAHAQSFNEGWEPGPVTPGTAPVPAGWTSVNNSTGGPGTNPNWQLRNDGAVFAAFTGTTYAFANYNSATGANDISNYLISPLLSLNNGDTISFYTRTVDTPNFADRLELVYNTTGSTLPSDFTNVLVTVNPGLTLAGYPNTWTQFTATITGLSGPTGGRFAFHYNPTNGGPLGANSDYIGIDDVVYTATGGGTLATNTDLGAGCYDKFASFYEAFVNPANFDLSNTAITLLNAGTGYIVTNGGSYNAVGSLGTPTVLALGDDTSITAGTLGIEVGSNGWIALGAGNSLAFTPDVATMLSNPSTGFYCWTDLNVLEVGSGQVQYEENGTLAQITYDGVYAWGGTSAADANFIQFQVNIATGDVTIAWGAMPTTGNGFLVGYSPGGANLDPGNSNLSDVASGLVVLNTELVDAPAMSLAATTRPVTGTNWNLQSANGALVDLMIIGLADAGIPDLFFLGLPGCGLRATLDTIIVGSAASIPVPAGPGLIGVSVYANAASLAPGVNPFGAITSNGVQGTIGDV